MALLTVVLVHFQEQEQCLRKRNLKVKKHKY
jgi:hypothetical protein